MSAAGAFPLARYDAMCSAIAECHAVDEVLDVKDKARALEVYAMQVRNIDAERKACDVRLRAERRVGELLKELQKTTAAEAASLGGKAKAAVSNGATRQPASSSPYTVALQANGISRQSAHRYEQLADVPEPVFEEALRAPDIKPSTTRIIAAARDPSPRINEDALWLWGRLRDFERARFVDMDLPGLLDSMTDTMRADVRRIAPTAADFFNSINEVRHEPA